MFYGKGITCKIYFTILVAIISVMVFSIDSSSAFPRDFRGAIESLRSLRTSPPSTIIKVNSEEFKAIIDELTNPSSGGLADGLDISRHNRLSGRKQNNVKQGFYQPRFSFLDAGQRARYGILVE